MYKCIQIRLPCDGKLQPFHLGAMGNGMQRYATEFNQAKDEKWPRK